MKILITAATSAQAYKLKSQLSNNEIILGDYGDIPAFMKMLKLPNPLTDTYAHEMLTLCLDNEVEKVYLLDRQEAGILLKSKQLFSEYNIELIDGNNF